MRHTILIIENDSEMREYITEVLELNNYGVIKAENGKLGVEQAQNYNPHLIICDITLPEFDGYQVLELLKKNPKTAIIPFILLINKAEAENVYPRKGMELGADDYLVQPFYTMELINAIESRLHKKDREKFSYDKSLKNTNEFTPEEPGLRELEEMYKGSKAKQFKKKQTIYYEGDLAVGIYYIINGLIKTVKRTEDGRELLTNIYGPNEYLGVPSLLLNEPYHATAQALENSSLSLLPKDLVLQLLKRYPDLIKQFFKIVVKDVWEKEEQILQIAYHSVRKRIAEVLLRLAKFKDKEMKVSLTVLEMSGDDLAAMAGVSTETVSRVLSSFKEEGLIQKEGPYIYLLDKVKLQQMKN